ncbi:uncharacterized protein LOC119390210 [Rhipicephalus sanguineus]|uniref:uncharacterized protein LOC119390210 n=1 Tax=Rhipicephalus sanguineus TaxID=34632 RepID=UPI0020C45D01|nr:uncharacterized protein LOC119390210 [Rhipicephalus sanguineus]
MTMVAHITYTREVEEKEEVERIAPRNALLADLQQTTASLSNGSSPMYSSINRPGAFGKDHNMSHTVTTERYDYKPSSDKTSPIYQNQYIVREVTTTTTNRTSSPTSPRSRRLLDGAASPPTPRRSPISNNLSELDNLLEDLNTAKFPPQSHLHLHFLGAEQQQT